MTHVRRQLTCLFMVFSSMAWGQTPSFESLRTATPGLAVGLAYAQDGSAPTIRVEGPLWKGSAQNVTEEARWHIGSITKSMTATLVMRQVDRGNLDLDAPIGPYLRRFEDVHPAWKALTLRQLLSHTSGLRANPTVRQFSALRGEPSVKGRHSVLGAFITSPPANPPGNHLYSNLGYMLAGLVLEEATAREWEDLMVEDLAEPLGLTTLGFGPPQEQTDPKGHRNLVVTLRVAERDDPAADNPAWLGPAGTAHMSLGDIVRYGQAHLAACRGEMPEFLTKESCQEMQTPVADNYGFGWVNQNGTVWHNGSNTMWYAILMLDPESGSVVAATQNAMRKPAQIDALARATQESLQN